MTYLIVRLVLFFRIRIAHAPAERRRARQIIKVGLAAWKDVYSLISDMIVVFRDCRYSLPR